MGTSSVWNDNCEFESMPDMDSRVCGDGRETTIGRVKPVMSNIMCMITKEAIRENTPEKRPFVVCRAGHAGIQRYAQTWAGDNETSWRTLEYNVATILGMGLSGVANQGCDVGGFMGVSPEPELFVRWVQQGIFQPRFSIHSENSDNTVTEPWMYEKYTGLVRDAIRLRYSMFPYMYSLMARAREKGLPIMQPMVSVFQHDGLCDSQRRDYMLGDSLLVANVLEKGAKTRSVYLPEGEVFFDYYTREEFKGGQTLEFPVDIASIPLFVRGGGIIPFALETPENLHTARITGLRLLCAPAERRQSRFVLYEDDGVTNAFEKGVYLKTRVTMTADEQVTLSFEREGGYVSSVRTVCLDVICRERAPLSVTVDGKTLPRYLDARGFESAESGWRYDMDKKSALVKYTRPSGDYKAVLSLEEFDMIDM